MQKCDKHLSCKIYLLSTSLATDFASNFKANNIVSPSWASRMNSIELRPASWPKKLLWTTTTDNTRSVSAKCISNFNHANNLYRNLGGSRVPDSTRSTKHNCLQAKWTAQTHQYIYWTLTLTLHHFGNRTSPSDNSNDRWKRLCLDSWAAAHCVWTLRALTRNLLTYLLTYLHTRTVPVAECILMTRVHTSPIHVLQTAVSTQRASTDAGETPQCPYLYNRSLCKTTFHIFHTPINLQFWSGRPKIVLTSWFAQNLSKAVTWTVCHRADGPSFSYEKLVRETWYKKLVRVS